MTPRATPWICAIALMACARTPRPSERATPARHTSPTGIGAAEAVGRQVGPDAVVPLVEYHLHLMSPALARVWAPPTPVPVRLPPELDGLMRARERAWRDSTGLARLYADSATLQDAEGPSTVRGRSTVAAFLAEYFARPYRVTPVAFGSGGSGGFIAGYLTRGDSTAPRHFAQVLFSLSRGRDGVWRIAAEALSIGGPAPWSAVTADDLIPPLNAAGIRRAVVLSLAYAFGSPFLDSPVEDEYGKVRAENDWTAEQAARYPGRLIAFCSMNPLRDYALRELDRCAKDSRFRGVKLHFANSRVDYDDPRHVEQLRRFFRAVNDHRLPVVVHMRATSGRPYGRKQAEIFLHEIVPSAPDIPIQIAHLAGSGPGTNDQEAMEALAYLADAVEAGDPRTKNLYFDVATIVTTDISPQDAALVATRIRQLGIHRVLFGSDMLIGRNPPPLQAWAAFHGLLPLTDAEFRTIAGNVTPWAR